MRNENILDEKTKSYIKRYLAGFKPYDAQSVIQKWNYTGGCVLLGAYALYQQTGETNYLEVLDRFANEYVDPTGNIVGYDPNERNVDLMCSARIFNPLYELTGQDRFRRGLDRVWQDLMEQPRCACGTFWHKKIYPNQIWLDGLYMVQPLMVEYVAHEKPEYGYGDTLHQFANVRKYMFDAASGLYRHGYDESRQIFWADPITGLSASVWLRSVGWLVMAMVDCYQAMEAPQTEKQLLSDLLQELIDGLAPYADTQSGLYYQVVDKKDLPGNYLESSGNAMVAYALLKGSRLGMLKQSAAEKGARMFCTLVDTMLIEDGDQLSLINVCETAGLGPADNLRRDGTAEYYVSEPVKPDNIHGAAALMLAYSEYLAFCKRD